MARPTGSSGGNGKIRGFLVKFKRAVLLARVALPTLLPTCNEPADEGAVALVQAPAKASQDLVEELSQHALGGVAVDLALDGLVADGVVAQGGG